MYNGELKSNTISQKTHQLATLMSFNINSYLVLFNNI